LSQTVKTLCDAFLVERGVTRKPEQRQL